MIKIGRNKHQQPCGVVEQGTMTPAPENSSE